MEQANEEELSEKHSELRQTFADRYEDIKTNIRIRVFQHIKKGELKSMEGLNIEDFVDEVFEKTYMRVLSAKHLAKYSTQSPIGWVTRYAYNIIHEHRKVEKKRAKKFQAVSDLDKDGNNASISDTLDQLSTNHQDKLTEKKIHYRLDSTHKKSTDEPIRNTIERKLEGEEPLEQGDIDKLLSSLSPTQAEIAKMKYLDGFSYQEISQKTGKKEATIRKIIERIKKANKAKLLDH